MTSHFSITYAMIYGAPKVDYREKNPQSMMGSSLHPLNKGQSPQSETSSASAGTSAEVIPPPWDRVLQGLSVPGKRGPLGSNEGSNTYLIFLLLNNTL